MIMGKLKVRDEAPEIAGRSLNMGEFRLSDLRGRERVYLVFSRYFGCPICQLDFKELLERAEEAGLRARTLRRKRKAEPGRLHRLEGG